MVTDMTIENPCSIQGCGRPNKSKGMCGTHYERVRRNGDLVRRKKQPKDTGGKACELCGKLFFRGRIGGKMVGITAFEGRRFCSKRCSRASRPIASLEERISPFIRRGRDDECWPWIGHLQPNGYGRLAFDGVSTGAHRAAYTAWVGDIPEGMIVRHKCDNRPCCNPNHLEPGTPQDNMNDMLSRNRACQGEEHPNTKITADIVRAIRGMSAVDAVASFCIGRSQVRRIQNRTSWRHVD